MKRRAMGSLFRPTVTRRVDGKKKRGRAKFFWVRYIDNAGVPQCHVLKLANGQRITDKSVADTALNTILRRQERLTGGLVDPMVEAAGMSMRVVLGRYIRHLRGKHRSRKYVKQAIASNKWMMDRVGMDRLADFNEDKLDRALAVVSDTGGSPATVNSYRKHAVASAAWAVENGLGDAGLEPATSSL